MSIIKNIRLFNGEVFVPLDAIRFENGRIQELYTHYGRPGTPSTRTARSSPLVSSTCTSTEVSAWMFWRPAVPRIS